MLSEYVDAYKHATRTVNKTTSPHHHALQ